MRKAFLGVFLAVVAHDVLLYVLSILLARVKQALLISSKI